MATSNSAMDQVANMSSITPLTATTTEEQDDHSTPIVSASVVAGVILVAVIAIVVLKRLFKSPRSKYGDDKPVAKRDKEGYFDQFNVNDQQTTVNSTTAITWENDEEKTSSGVEFDSNTESVQEENKITSGKRTFTVKKVAEKKGSPTSPGQQVVLKVPKHFAHDVYRSLQSGEGQYTLALIDERYKTVHNVDLREYRFKKSPNSKGSRELRPKRSKQSLHSGKVSFNGIPLLPVHNSPDGPRKCLKSDGSSGSATDMSDTSHRDPQSASISSVEEAEIPEPQPTDKLL